MLKRKLWRDIKGNYGAYLACISVLVIGLMLYVSLALTLDSITEKQREYYSKYSFADGFAQLAQGPRSLVEDLQGINGIKAVVGRIVQEVQIYKPKGEDNTTLRLVTFDGENQPVNRFMLDGGRVPRDGEKEVLVTSAFLKANNYKIGQRVPLIIKGKQVDVLITGTLKSPEYTYEIPNGQTLAPDPKAFGVAFIPYTALAPLVGMDGQINDLAFMLKSGNTYDMIKLSVTKALDPYGLTQLIPRKDQLSNSMLNQEIVGLKGSANSTPVIFLMVAASILYIMLRRMVEQQRGQIGLLKAFGFNGWEIVGHYLSYAAFIGILGGLVGGLAGTWLSYVLAKVYQQYYNIPGLTGKFSFTYILLGTALALIFSLIAGFQGCRGVLKLSPAEAMRPSAPKTSGRTLVERFALLWQALSTQGKMALRNVFRNKQRSIFAILGIASAFSMMVASKAAFDATYFLINFQYDQVERYDLKVGLNQYVDKNSGIAAGEHLAGVTKAEPMLEVPVSMSNKWLKKDVAVIGLPKDSYLYKLLTKDNRPVVLPDQGLIISEQLAKLLNLKEGERATIKPFLGEKKERQVTVTRIIPQYVGLGAYMEIDALSQVLRSTPVASSILLQAERDKIPELRKELQKGSNVGSIHDKNKAKAQFEQLMESSQASQFILLFMAFITGFAIVYNINIISLSERERELATLMVLGMTEKEIGRILLMEQGVLGVMSFLVGLPMSYSMLYAIVSASGSEIYNMPLIVAPTSFLVAVAGTLLFLATAQWKIIGRIGKLSMLDVLKEGE